MLNKNILRPWVVLVIQVMITALLYFILIYQLFFISKEGANNLNANIVTVSSLIVYSIVFLKVGSYSPYKLRGIYMLHFTDVIFASLATIPQLNFPYYDGLPLALIVEVFCWPAEGIILLFAAASILKGQRKNV